MRIMYDITSIPLYCACWQEYFCTVTVLLEGVLTSIKELITILHAKRSVRILNRFFVCLQVVRTVCQ